MNLETAFNNKLGSLERIIAFMNCEALFLHHACSCYVVAALNLELWTMDHEIALITLPLVAQHWFPAIGHAYPRLRLLGVVICEIIFEVAIYNSFWYGAPDKYDCLLPTVEIVMLLAHHLYISTEITTMCLRWRSCVDIHTIEDRRSSLIVRLRTFRKEYSR
jgi:hypothetical protein